MERIQSRLKKYFDFTADFSKVLIRALTELHSKNEKKKNMQKKKSNDLGCVDGGARAAISAELRASWG